MCTTCKHEDSIKIVAELTLLHLCRRLGSRVQALGYLACSLPLSSRKRAVAQHAQKHSGGTARKVNGGCSGLCASLGRVLYNRPNVSIRSTEQGTLQVAIGYRADLRGTRQTLGPRSVLESLKVVLHQDGSSLQVS